jgi:hypothetical protein
MEFCHFFYGVKQVYPAILIKIFLDEQYEVKHIAHKECILVIQFSQPEISTFHLLVIFLGWLLWP